MIDYLSSEIDDLCETMMNGVGGSSTLGSFTELLGFQHFNNTTPKFCSIFDHHNHDHDDQGPNQGKFVKLDHDRYPIKDKAFMNHSHQHHHQQQLPMTPNCSTISSESSKQTIDPFHDHDPRTSPIDDTHDEQHRQQRNKPTKPELKVKKSCDMKNTKRKQKQNKEARVAIMTRSEVDHLEDGFRWRKYGQKTLKNSPFPRSYYRCTNSTCNVKKRVERSLNDPTVVVTTYQGKHTHPSPILMHHHHAPATFTATAFAPPPQIPLPYNHHQYYNSNFLLGTALDHGLQDIVPSLAKKE